MIDMVEVGTHDWEDCCEDIVKKTKKAWWEL